MFNIDIDFPNMPCYLLEFHHSTEVAYINHKDIAKSLELRHLDRNGVEVDEDTLFIPSNPDTNVP
jgi:hypothetical protein